MSEANYENPKVAYNTGYNDGQREEREDLLNAIAAFEISLLNEERHITLPQICGRLTKLRAELQHGTHRARSATPPTSRKVT